MANITLFAQVIGKLPKKNIRKIIRTAGSKATQQVPFQDFREASGFCTRVINDVLHDWAHHTTKKSAVKMHTLLDYDSLLPEFENNTLCDTLRIKIFRTILIFFIY